jgi:hypothetical protein
MDLQILCSKALSRDGEVASRIWWGSDRAERWASVAADNYAHTYAIVTLMQVLGRRSDTMAAIIEKTESEEHKAALYQAEVAE